ncbi:MAG: 3,4-dihydroxy-2-butanone-4-phosphate synthase [Phycisphaeraceae bacterium]|nr:3,4-dihydroxy-2-butanone-4-phosphate synthase [Phycisphaerales bacterium]MCB9860029.1 3,4-dihydroxy-2-butanone-4-phosphate synthase [Phycisphaeraceae bacterium]
MATTKLDHLDETARAGTFSPVSELLEELRAGRIIILCDDEHRENEGDMVVAAEHVTPEIVTFMLTHARGYMCLSLTEADCDRLELHDQAAVNTSVRGTPFTVSIDGHPRHGFTTGVSARERARTIKLALDPESTPDDFVRPGHINPLRSRDGGVLVRTGQTEGSVDLCRLAGLQPAALIIEIMGDDGEMLRGPALADFARQHGIKMGTIADIIEYRLARESLVRRVDTGPDAKVKTPYGEFDLIVFESLVDPLPHIVLSVGGVGLLDSSGRVKSCDDPTLVRMHRRNLLGDVFDDPGASEHSTGSLLRASMKRIQAEGRGCIVYLRPEGIGEDLAQKLLTIRRPKFESGTERLDLTHPDSMASGALPMDQREFGVGGQILRQLGLTRLRVLTNTPKAMPGLDAFGLEIIEQVHIR